MKSIFDRTFRYTSSAETDLHKVFAREKRRLKELEEKEKQLELERISKVRQIGGKK